MPDFAARAKAIFGDKMIPRHRLRRERPPGCAGPQVESQTCRPSESDLIRSRK
jgi:hypothetical protein